MEYRGMDIPVLDAARRQYPAGTRVRITRGRYANELAVVESVDDATFHELGEVVLWVDRGRGREYQPCSVMINEVEATQTTTTNPALCQALSSRSRGVRKRGVTRTAPIVPASLSAS